MVSHLERLANSARLLITMSWREKQSPTEKSESESQGFWGTQLEAHSQELYPFAIKCFAHKSTSAYHVAPWALVEDEAKWVPTGRGFLRLLRELSSCSHKLGNRVAGSISGIVISYFLTPKFVSLAPDQGCWLEPKGMKPIWQPWTIPVLAKLFPEIVLTEALTLDTLALLKFKMENRRLRAQERSVLKDPGAIDNVLACGYQKLYSP